MNITKLPVKYRRPKEITAKEIWDSPQPSDLMVWEVCPYVTGPLDNEGCIRRCSGCPAWEEDERFGQVKSGCRGLAEEVCRIVMAVQRREAKNV